MNAVVEVGVEVGVGVGVEGTHSMGSHPHVANAGLVDDCEALPFPLRHLAAVRTR